MGRRARGTGLEVSEDDGRVDKGGERGDGCGGDRTLSVMKRVSRDQHHSPVVIV